MVRSKKATAVRVAASYAVLVAFALVALYPVWQIFNISLRPSNRLLSTSLELIPANASFANYVALFTERPFLLWMLNSTFVAFTVTLTGVALASTCGYAFSRFSFIGKKIGLLSLLVMVAMAIRKRYMPNDHVGLWSGVLYWHFLGALWIYLLLFLVFVH